jgi:LDH2 family malate/lactate/ureidoglycolate dehydrogenase
VSSEACERHARRIELDLRRTGEAAMNDDNVNLSADAAAALAARGLVRIGYAADEADTIAAHLVDSELMGYPALGLSRVLTIAEHPLAKQPRRAVAITHETPVSARVDGGNHVGMYVMRRAAEIAIDKARNSGFAFVGAHNTFLSGRSAYYLDLIAGAGFVGLHFACSPPVVAALGGAGPTFGTNPIAFGVPRKPYPVIIDIATSAANVGDLMLAARLGRDLPDGVAIDAKGKPTRDPTAALSGAILPFGGHKGSGLSFAVQVMGLLGGAAMTRGEVRDFGFLFLAFDPGLLLPAGALQGQLDDLVAEIKATPRQPGIAEIRVPSERAYAERARRMVHGIEVPRTIVERIEAL